MKKNVYFQTVFRRDNLFKNFIFDFAMKIASYPKMLLEVFIRKNFGQRYFSLATAITVFIITLFLPVFVEALKQEDTLYGYSNRRAHFWSHYASWYIFLLAFIVFAIIRWQETRRNPSVFDFARFSLYTGDINPLFNKLDFSGTKPSVRAIEIFFEPALFVIAGILLLLFKQNLGNLVIVSGICYGLSYAGQYKKGDDFVIDKIDEMILNEEMENVFVNDLTADNARGVRFYAHKPKAKVLRQKLADTFVEGDQEIEEPTFAE